MRRSELKDLIKEIVRTCLESPDHVTFTDPNNPNKKISATWIMEDMVEAVILIASIGGKKDYFAYLPKKKDVKSSDREYEKRWQEYQKQNPEDRISIGLTCTHGDVISRIHRALPEIRDSWSRITNARLYSYQGKYIIAFWEPLKRCRDAASQVQQLFDDIGVDFQSTAFEPSGYEGKYISADEYLGTALAKPEFNTNDMADQEKLHLMPPGPEKEKLLKKQRMYKHPGHVRADRAKMPLAQVRQMYPGMAAAE